jgi:cytochrome c-type biogenesis protein CcmH/NrfF
MEGEMTRVALLFLLSLSAVWTQGADQIPADPAQQQRIRQLEESLLAPCCWAESVSVHRSEIALQMRMEIERFVFQGQTDREILDHYKRIHGARILIEPEGAFRLWVYVIPAVAILAGLGLVLFVIRRLLRPVSEVQPT